MAKDWDTLIDQMKNGSIRALSRLISKIEDREAGWMDAMKQIYPHTGKARLIGITGSPGAGKSTLTNRIALDLVEKGFKLGVIAVDPTSPFSGGAILADRVRMMDVSRMEGVLVRSMATRGTLGGLNQSARDVAKLMDAFGKDFVIIETVGVGQDEVEVVRTTDLVLVVCVPGQGDALQAIKAGVMEIADIFVVNKADREGADQVVMDIEGMLSLGSHQDGPTPRIMKTVATNNQGVSELVDQTLDLLESAGHRTSWQKARVREELVGLVEKELVDRIKTNWDKNGGLDRAVEQVLALEKDPYSIVQDILSSLSPLLPETR